MTNRFRSLVFYLLIAVLVWSASPAAAQEASPDGLAAALAVERAVQEAIASAETSVVAIARGRRGSAERMLSRDYIPQEFAAGVVVDPQGLILTTYHALGDPGRSDYVVWVAGKPYPVQRVQPTEPPVKAADPWSDLAILKIDAKGLKPIAFGDGAKVRKGQIVIALGNPYAIARDGEASASWGIIANLRRAAAPAPGLAGDGRKETMHHYGTLIQTDARLGFGASGGALVNLRGEMVGLTTSLAAGAIEAEAAGYAIPVDESFQRIVERLKSGREIAYGFLGVSLEGPESRFLQPANLPGVPLVQVFPGTPAQRAGLQGGDIVTHVNGETVESPDELILTVGRLSVDQPAQLRVLRRGLPLSRHVKLTKKPPSSMRPVIASDEPPPWRGVRIDYASAVPTFARSSLAGEIDAQGCVAVESVALDSPAWKAGLRQGMFISHVSGRRVESPAEFRAEAEKRKGPVELRLTRPVADSLRVTVPGE